MTKKNSPTVRIVEIDREPIELYKLLKFENLVQSGGEAKFVISQGLVRLNGSVETRKRKKIVTGDVIEFNEERFSVAVLNPA
ncbi:MAG: RNA-binding S4 domain-containing protein [Desulfobacterales bacterium]|nr:RNA-binding S4 domain-containing protein [Desulfobacterales bacterium]